MGVYRIGDVIKRNREFLHMTQEKLCEGICSVQTLSRIENGKQNAGKDVYKCLMERMGKETERAYTMISGDDFRVLEYARAYENSVSKFEYENADRILKKLEILADDSPTSRQYVMQGRAIIDWGMKRISPQEGRNQLWAALELTIENPRQQDYIKYPLREIEVSILYNIANTYFDEGEIEKAIAMVEILYEGIGSGYRVSEKNWTLEPMLLDNLANMYGELGEHRKAIELTRQGIDICRQTKSSGDLPQLLGEMEWNMEQLLDKGETVDFTVEDCERILKQACYMASALGHNHKWELMKNHYKEYFGKSYRY